MSPDQNWPPRSGGERIVAVEIRIRHLESTIKEMSEQVSDMHDLLMQAKGARWVIVAMASLGGFVAGLGAHLPFLGK